MIWIDEYIVYCCKNFTLKIFFLNTKIGPIKLSSENIEKCLGWNLLCIQYKVNVCKLLTFWCGWGTGGFTELFNDPHA